jgi:hypothetical protein
MSTRRHLLAALCLVDSTLPLRAVGRETMSWTRWKHASGSSLTENPTLSRLYRPA